MTFRSDKRENPFFRYNNYNWVYKYNYNKSDASSATATVSVQPEVAVVVGEEDLFFPKQIKKHQRTQAMNILRKHLPEADTATQQEIFDEMHGMIVEVRNPLGLLNKLALAAADGTFTAVNAPTVRYTREQLEKRKKEEQKRDEAEKLAFQKRQQQQPDVKEKLAENLNSADEFTGKRTTAAEILASRMKNLQESK